MVKLSKTHIYGIVGESKESIGLELLYAVEKNRVDVQRVRELAHQWELSLAYGPASEDRELQKEYFELRKKTPSWGFKFRDTIIEYPDGDFKISDILTMDEFFSLYDVDAK